MLLLFTCAVPVRAEWREFRGPTGQGHAEASNLPIEWSEEKNVRWKTPVKGLAWSSPVIAGDRVYLTNAVQIGPQKHSLRMVAMNVQSGEPLWEKELFQQSGEVEFHKKNSHASSTPLIEGDRIYVHFGPHGTACTTLDGEVLWKTKVRYSPRHGNGGSPASAGDLLIICCDGHDKQFVVGMEKETGKIRWRTDRETDPERGFSFSTPLIIEADGRRQAVCPGSDAVFAYDPATGKELWRVDYLGGYSVVPRPVFAGGLVFVCTGWSQPVLLAIDPTGTGNVTDTHVRWRTSRGTPNSPSVLVVGDELYMVSDQGVASCLDVRTGNVHWTERLGGNFSASPLYADGKIYFQDEHGTATVIQPGTTYQELAKNTFADGERTYASYAVDGAALLVRSESALYRIQHP